MSASITAQGAARLRTQKTWRVLRAIRAYTSAELRRPLAEEATSQASEAVDMVDERGLISSTSDDFSHTRL